MSYSGWAITHDFIAENESESAVGTRSMKADEAEASGVKGQPFTLWDDDGNKYYKGVIWENWGEEGNAEDDEEPWYEAYLWGGYFAGTADIRNDSGQSIIG